MTKFVLSYGNKDINYTVTATIDDPDRHNAIIDSVYQLAQPFFENELSDVVRNPAENICEDDSTTVDDCAILLQSRFSPSAYCHMAVVLLSGFRELHLAHHFEEQ